ncbi:MAG: TIGR00269 family protein [Methanomicrobiales archaeon]
MPAGKKECIPPCDNCDEPAIFFDPGLQRHLCERHLCLGVEQRVTSALTRHKMVSDGDRIAVGLSGGKDSSVLLSVLSHVIPEHWDAEIIAVTVDEGIAGYREETIQSAVSLTQQLGIPHHIVSFQSLFGTTLDSLLNAHPLRACTACGILRKKALSDAAREIAATSIATGHNLDDAAQSVLMNYFRGDFERLLRDSSSREDRGFIRRIKPLHEVNEKEITLYSMIKGITGLLPECPYATTAFRAEVRTLQAAIEYHYPGASRRIIEGQESLNEQAKKTIRPGTVSYCASCGDPCSGPVCQACGLLSGLNKGD